MNNVLLDNFGASNPVVAAQILALYAHAGCRVVDPFAGRGTYVTLAAKAGCQSVGIELNKDKVKDVNALIKAESIDNAKVIQGDARDLASIVPHESTDLLFTCPPYWNAERYNGGDKDLSMVGEDDFEVAIAQVVRAAFDILCPGGFSVWVTGLARNSNKELVHIPAMVTQFHRGAGFMLHDEAIIYENASPALMRVGSVSKGAGLLIRRHEYIQVFAKPQNGKLPTRLPLREGRTSVIDRLRPLFS